jgi:hypothetical protein
LFYPKIPDYSILKGLKETGRGWTLDNGSFFHFQLCIAEAAMEDLTSSEAQFAYLLQFKTAPSGLQSYAEVEREPIIFIYMPRRTPWKALL